MTLFLSYVVAFITTTVITNWASILLLFPFLSIIHRLKNTFPYFRFVTSIIGAILAIYTYTIVADKTSLSLSYFMFLLPGLFILWNDTQRVSRAMNGNSRVRQILEIRGEEYIHKIDVLSEQYSEFGHVIGYFIGLIFVVGKAGFFS